MLPPISALVVWHESYLHYNTTRFNDSQNFMFDWRTNLKTATAATAAAVVAVISLPIILTDVQLVANELDKIRCFGQLIP